MIGKKEQEPGAKTLGLSPGPSRISPRTLSVLSQRMKILPLHPGVLGGPPGRGVKGLYHLRTLLEVFAVLRSPACQQLQVIPVIPAAGESLEH